MMFLSERYDWVQKAACTGMTDLMFDESRKREAIGVCNTCSVRCDCLDYALSDKTLDECGVFGGLTDKNRRSLRSRLRQNTQQKEPQVRQTVLAIADLIPARDGQRPSDIALAALGM